MGKALKKGSDAASSLVPIALEVAKPFTENVELKQEGVGSVIESFLTIKTAY